LTYTTICAACSTQFDAASPAARTCSGACRVAVYRRRQAARRTAAVRALTTGLHGDAGALSRGLADAFDLLRPAA
jgi:hypothetical protein